MKYANIFIRFQIYRFLNLTLCWECYVKLSNKERPVINLTGIVLDCTNAEDLAEFYHKLLGWKKTHSGNGWAGLTAPNGMVLAFQAVDEYKPPVWPWKPVDQGQMIHLDMRVNNLEKAVEFAVSCGAQIADAQYFDDSRTMIDPAGHTFCLDASHLTTKL